MKTVLKIISFCFLVSCFSKSELQLDHKGFRKKTIRIPTIISEYEKKETYVFQLPANSNKQKIYPQNGKLEIEYQYKFSDNSIFYLSNDTQNGSYLNFGNRVAAGTSLYSKNITDTINIYGKQDNGLFWRENMLGEIVVGYINADADMKKKLDITINSINKK